MSKNANPSKDSRTGTLIDRHENLKTGHLFQTLAAHQAKVALIAIWMRMRWHWRVHEYNMCTEAISFRSRSTAWQLQPLSSWLAPLRSWRRPWPWQKRPSMLDLSVPLCSFRNVRFPSAIFGFSHLRPSSAGPFPSRSALFLASRGFANCVWCLFKCLL